MEKCVICQKDTDKCCSLCRKMFYCSPEHQEVHWHMTHKFSCEGKHHSLESNQQDFKFYVQSQVKEGYQSVSPTIEQEAKVFMELFENRLHARSELVSKFTSLKQSNTPPILLKDLVRQSEQLVDQSRKVSESYQVGMGEHLQQVYGLVTNNFIVKIDELLDKVLLARSYQLACMAQELMQTMIVIANEIEPYPSYLGEQFKKSYRNLLWAIIDISENISLDKIAQKMFANFIKICQRFQGIWEQVYAYFNMGVWYSNKTYYHKAIKCFIHASELATGHKISEGSSILKADAYYNIALCSYAIQDKQNAIQQMQEAYRMRSQSLGKTNFKTSQTLLMLAKWLFAERKYDVCLQYVMECYRIRKLNPSFVRQLQEVDNLIVQIHETIKKERDEHERKGNFSSGKYYSKLLESQMTYKEQDTDRKESFTKRLLQQQKDLVTFSLHVTGQFFDNLTSKQLEKLSKLKELEDQQMQREEAIRIILEGEFTQSLSQRQKDQFIKLNKMT